MKKEEIDRINELYRKSKAEGLTDAEQTELRQRFIADVKGSLTAHLNNIDMVSEDGTVENLGEKYAAKNKLS